MFTVFQRVFTVLARPLTAPTAASALRIVELVIVALLGKRVDRALERRNNLVLRIPLRIQERFRFLSRAQDHSATSRRPRCVSKTGTTAHASPTVAAATATATTCTAILAPKGRELCKCCIKLGHICGPMHIIREQHAGLVRVVGYTTVLLIGLAGTFAVLAGTFAMFTRFSALTVTTTSMQTTGHFGKFHTLGQGTSCAKHGSASRACASICGFAFGSVLGCRHLYLTQRKKKRQKTKIYLFEAKGIS